MAVGVSTLIGSSKKVQVFNCRRLKTFIILPLFIIIFPEQMESAPRLELQNDVCSILQVPKRQQSILELAAEPSPSSISLNEEPSVLIDNFLNECPVDAEHPLLNTAPERVESTCQVKVEEKHIVKDQKKRKIRKKRRFKSDNNSPFHNYQKHLVVALKSLVMFSDLQNISTEEQKNVARQIWDIYQQSETRSKKVLHFIFNENTQYTLTEEQLKNFGFLEIYQQYGEETYRKAKEYLTRLALKQIDLQNVRSYIWASKIKDKNCFQNYIFNFKEELRSGFLKKRMIIE